MFTPSQKDIDLIDIGINIIGNLSIEEVDKANTLKDMAEIKSMAKRCIELENDTEKTSDEIDTELRRIIKKSIKIADKIKARAENIPLLHKIISMDGEELFEESNRTG